MMEKKLHWVQTVQQSDIHPHLQCKSYVCFLKGKNKTDPIYMEILFIACGFIG